MTKLKRFHLKNEMLLAHKFVSTDLEEMAGQIIMMGTDGIWEAQSPSGEMFGKNRFKDIIRQNAARPAKEIIQTVIKAVDRFCHPLEKSDDVTLVVAKIT